VAEKSSETPAGYTPRAAQTKIPSDNLQVRRSIWIVIKACPSNAIKRMRKQIGFR
jgi:hypothetical protein